jgi:hypothetical protein
MCMLNLKFKRAVFLLTWKKYRFINEVIINRKFCKFTATNFLRRRVVAE